MVRRVVVPNSEGQQVVIEGEQNEPLPEGVFYVDPTSNSVIGGQEGNTVKDIPSNAIELPRRPWHSSSPLPTPWYRTKEGLERLRPENVEMQRYFPDFQLFMDDKNENKLLWVGKLIKNRNDTTIYIVYPNEYPKARPIIILPEQSETRNQSINKAILGLWNAAVTAPMLIVMVLRMLLEEEGKVCNGTEQTTE